MADDRRGRTPPQRAESEEDDGDRGSLFLDVLSSLLLVAVIAMAIFVASGVWPPMVAIESGSMEPNMQKGDLVLVTEPDRFAPDESFRDTGIVTRENGSERGHEAFGGAGTVVVYDSPERYGPPIIHRVHFHVEDGENWYDRANEDYVAADSCDELSNCPAPHDGFITKGDNNDRYDQASGIAPPVRQEWITGAARYRVPYLGCARLAFTANSCRTPATVAA